VTTKRSPFYSALIQEVLANRSEEILKVAQEIMSKNLACLEANHGHSGLDAPAGLRWRESQK
jgi:hypothetical protein